MYLHFINKQVLNVVNYMISHYMYCPFYYLICFCLIRKKVFEIKMYKFFIISIFMYYQTFSYKLKYTE